MTEAVTIAAIALAVAAVKITRIICEHRARMRRLDRFKS